MNKVLLMGRLTRDPETRYSNTQNGQMAITRFTIAVDRRGKKTDGQQSADFISCTTFGNLAEFAEKYLKKGSQIATCGRIQSGSYDKNGTKVYTTDVILEEIEFAGNKNGNNGDNSRPSPSEAANNSDFMNIPENVEDDSLPFH